MLCCMNKFVTAWRFYAFLSGTIIHRKGHCVTFSQTAENKSIISSAMLIIFLLWEMIALVGVYEKTANTEIVSGQIG